MAYNTFAPFGFKYSIPIVGSSANQQYERFVIKNGYSSKIYEGSPVSIDENGFLISSLNQGGGAKAKAKVTAGSTWAGIFMNCTFNQSTSPATWPGLAQNMYNPDITVSGVIKASISSDPTAIYTVQGLGKVDLNVVGANAVAIINDDNGNPLGDDSLGVSRAYIDLSTVSRVSSAALNYNVRIVGFAYGSSPGDENPTLLVKLNNHMYMSPANIFSAT